MSSPIQTLRSSHRNISLNLSIFSQGLLWLLLVSCACILMTALASAQDTKTRTTTSGSSVSVFTYKEIPAATGPCTPEECDWWNRLREAGNKLLRKGDGKSRSVFASLFVEGITLFSPPVQIADLPIKPRNGTVRLSVERRADGSVGDVKLLNGLGSQVDKRCIREAMNVIFLPAVRDHKFITAWETPEFKFYAAGAPK